MKNIRISGDALEDLNAGFQFYESQREGLGDYFASGIRVDIERLTFSAGTHPIVHRGIYRSLSKTFPYGIFYTLENGTVIVRAVLDLRRHPEWIRRNLFGFRDS